MPLSLHHNYVYHKITFANTFNIFTYICIYMYVVEQNESNIMRSKADLLKLLQHQP